MQNTENNKLPELNLRPLQELLTREIDLDALIAQLDKTYHYFSHYCMKVSCWDGIPIDEEEVYCQYWIERLKILFEEMKQ